jgi:glycosyltransferase involved in cell wall biosynthesis
VVKRYSYRRMIDLVLDTYETVTPHVGRPADQLGRSTRRKAVSSTAAGADHNAAHDKPEQLAAIWSLRYAPLEATMPDALRIAHVTSEIGYSGGEVQVFLLIDGLRARGYRVALLCPPGSRSAEEAHRRGIECLAVRMRNDLDWPAVIALARGFRKCGAGLVHLHTGRANWLGGLAARGVHLPAVTTRRMDRRVKRNWRTRLIYGHLVQRAVAISPAVAECLAAGGVPRERTEVIYDAVDPARLRPTVDRATARAALGARPTDWVLLVLAALIRRKGIDLLLDALPLLAVQDLRPLVWIAGDGPERAALMAQSARLGLERQVHFLGRREDTADLLAACDAFVLPSRREGLGVAALEAMAAGCPVVCSAIGGLQDSVVHGRTGLLFPPGDTYGLAQAVASIMRDDDLRVRFGQAGPGRIAEGFLAEQVVDAYERLYRSVTLEWETQVAPHTLRA